MTFFKILPCGTAVLHSLQNITDGFVNGPLCIIVKNFKSLIIMAFFSMLPCVVMAQQNMLKAIDSFVNGPMRTNVKSTITVNRDPDTNNTINFYYNYKFIIKKAEESYFDSVRTAFSKDSNCAYYIFEKPAYDDSDRKISISCAGTMNKTISFGNDYDSNYVVLLVKDPDNNTRRYAYALVWSATKKKITGEIFKILSPNPKEKDNESNLNGMDLNLSLNNFCDDSDDDEGRTIVISNGGNTTKVDDGNDTTVVSDGEKTILVNNGDTAYVSDNGKTTSFYYGGRRYDLNKRGGTIIVDNNNRIKIQGDGVVINRDSRTPLNYNSEVENRIAEAKKALEVVRKKLQEMKIKTGDFDKLSELNKLSESYDKSANTFDKVFSDKMSAYEKLFLKYIGSSSDESQNAIWTDLANKTVALCKEYKYKISEEAKLNNKYRVINMRGNAVECDQDSVAKILDEAINYLK